MDDEGGIPLELGGNELEYYPQQQHNIDGEPIVYLYNEHLKTVQFRFPDEVFDDDLDGFIQYIAQTHPDIRGLYIISAQNISQIPNNIGILSTLEELIISGTQIDQLPESIQELQHLRILDLNSNRFHSIPDWIGNMQSLEQLSFNANQLQEVHPSVLQIPYLHLLAVSNNQINDDEVLRDLVEGDIIVNVANNPVSNQFEEWLHQYIQEQEQLIPINYIEGGRKKRKRKYSRKRNRKYTRKSRKQYLRLCKRRKTLKRKHKQHRRLVKVK
jgi:hypothetical protein